MSNPLTAPSPSLVAPAPRRPISLTSRKHPQRSHCKRNSTERRTPQGSVAADALLLSTFYDVSQSLSSARLAPEGTRLGSQAYGIASPICRSNSRPHSFENELQRTRPSMHASDMPSTVLFEGTDGVEDMQQDDPDLTPTKARMEEMKKAMHRRTQPAIMPSDQSSWSSDYQSRNTPGEGPGSPGVRKPTAASTAGCVRGNGGETVILYPITPPPSSETTFRPDAASLSASPISRLHTRNPFGKLHDHTRRSPIRAADPAFPVDDAVHSAH